MDALIRGEFTTRWQLLGYQVPIFERVFSDLPDIGVALALDGSLGVGTDRTNSFDLDNSI